MQSLSGRKTRYFDGSAEHVDQQEIRVTQPMPSQAQTPINLFKIRNNLIFYILNFSLITSLLLYLYHYCCDFSRSTLNSFFDLQFYFPSDEPVNGETLCQGLK